MTDTLFVSHHGNDLNKCWRRSTPCRTVRHAVKIANDGDRIFVDSANGAPYLECENLTQTRYSMPLTKSVLFYGMNGKAEIRCTKRYDLFNITSPSSNITRVQFFDLVLSNSNIGVRLDVGTRSELKFQNVIVRNNVNGIYTKYSLDCSILIVNSTFEDNFTGGTRLQCLNVTAQIMASTFKLTPALFANIGHKPSRWQNMRIWVKNTIVDGENIQMCLELFAIQPFAITLNVTVIDSQFKNHVANCKPGDKISALHIHGQYRDNQMYLNRIFLSNLLIANNYNNWFTLALRAGYQEFTEVAITIKDTMFRNNSAALLVEPNVRDIHSQLMMPAIFFENNTFVDNVYEQFKPYGAAAIYFSSGNSRVTSCRFLDNKAGENSYVGVVTISLKARVTFYNSYFENKQTKVPSNQLFALGNQPLRFIGHNTFNLVDLKTRQSIIIRIPTAMGAGVSLGKYFKISCPQGYKLNPERFCDVIKTGNLCYYVNIQCEQCPTKTYTVERGSLLFNKSNNIQCQQCPRGGDCDSGLVKAKPNFWGYKTHMKVRFIQCPPGYCCDLKECPTYNGCNGNRSGTLCGHCPQGMSEGLFSTQCISNTKCSITYFFILGMIGLLFLYLVFFLYNTEILTCIKKIVSGKRLLRNSQENNANPNDNIMDSSGGMMKIFFYYYQVCNLLRSCMGCSNGSELISNIENAISRMMNMILFNLPTFSCPLKNLRPVPKVILLHSIGYCLLSLLCLLYFLRQLYLIYKRLQRGYIRTIALQYNTTRTNHASSSSKSSFSQRMVSAFTQISLLMYASSAQLCFSLLFCIPAGEDKVLFLDGNIKCYQPYQYFLLAYMISCIIPFYLVPVLGSYVFKFGQIGVKQFCAAFIFPLPFCCYWTYLLFQSSCRGNQERMHQASSEDRDEDDSDTELTFDHTEINHVTSERSQSAILSILSGPFRSHQPFMCFPASHIPWEGFLIFRRLALILVLTFVYDIQLRLFLALTLCVAILIIHTIVYPFQRKRDNILESFSLGTHAVLCGLALIKAIYYGEDFAFSKSQPVLNVIENVLVIAPLSVVLIFVIFYIVVKFASGLKICVFCFIRIIRRLTT